MLLNEFGAEIRKSRNFVSQTSISVDDTTTCPSKYERNISVQSSYLESQRRLIKPCVFKILYTFVLVSSKE